MSKSVVALATTTALVIGGYTAFWFKASDTFKINTEKNIERINNSAKKNGKSIVAIKYDSIDVSGYPFVMQLNIAKPVITFDAGEITKEMQKSKSKGQAIENKYADKPINWLLELAYSDNMTLTGNLFMNKFTLSTVGSSTTKSILNGEVRSVLLSSSSSPATCGLSISPKEGNLPWHVSKVFNDPKEFLSAFRSVDCSQNDFTTKDGKTSEIVSSGSLKNLSINSSENGDNRKISFAVDINTKALPGLDVIINDYANIIYDISQTPANKRRVVNYSEYGDQYVKADIDYNGPADPKNIQNPKGDISLNFTGSIKNALSSAESDMHFASLAQSGNRDTSFKLKTNSQVTPRDDRLLADSLAISFSDLIDKFIDKSRGENHDFMQKLSQTVSTKELVDTVTPKFSSFGKSGLDIDLKVTASDKLANGGNATLNSFDWVSELYGIKNKGTAKMEQGKPPVGDLVTTFVNCDALLTDLGNYAIRISNLIARVDPSKPPYVTQSLVNGVKQFIFALAENSAYTSSKDVLIHFVFNDKGPTISGKQFMEVIGLFGTTIAPYLPQQQPAQAVQPLELQPKNQ